MRHWIIGFAVSAALVGVVPAEATTVVFDNFGPGDTYDISVGYTLGYPGNEYDQGVGFGVSLAESVNVDMIELAVGHISGSNELDVWLMADAGGEPGGIIESFHFSGAMGPFGSNNPPLVGVSALRPTLTAGQQYWVIASVPDNDTWAAWNLNSIGDVGPRAAREGATGPWTIEDDERAVLRVTGTPVPEPATMALLGLAACGLGGYVRKRRKA